VATSAPGGTGGPPTSASSAPASPALAFERIASGFSRPTFVTNAGDGSNRLFVLEKPGSIRIIKDGKVAEQPFLDITSIVRSSGNEQGLLGLAFHPDYERNGRFFVAYTGLDAANTVAEYHVSADASRADPASARVLFAVPDQFPNHNGGMLAFGPDGYLYISMGDGGSAGDPNGNGQNLNAMLAKILRIDIDSATKPYGIPKDNPFVGRPGARAEVWAYGLRNPWRFSFDRQTGDMWIGDVGQNAYEEVDFQPASSKGGEDYGWNAMEGTHCYKPSSGCSKDGLVLPVVDYSHDGGNCSVTGGYVYRGKAYPALAGRYLYTDYCSGTIWSLTRDAGGKFANTKLLDGPGSMSSFGEDEAGELYMTNDSGGAVVRVTAK
jgi:glucose/arabinose dehydrogenase